MPKIDLDAARAARREARGGDPIELVVGGQTFTLPDEMPLAALEAFALAMGGQPAALIDGLGHLIGEENAATIRAQYELSLDDLLVIFEGASEAYGMTQGESSASPRS